MPSLIESNPYLRDPKRRRQMIAENVYDSSVFEGAVGLKNPHRRRKSQHTACIGKWTARAQPAKQRS